MNTNFELLQFYIFRRYQPLQQACNRISRSVRIARLDNAKTLNEEETNLAFVWDRVLFKKCPKCF